MISPTPRDFEIHEAFEKRVAKSGEPTTDALAEVADVLQLSAGQVAESCYLVQQLTRTIKTAPPLPATSDGHERAMPGEREDDTKEMVLRLHRAMDQLAKGPPIRP